MPQARDPDESGRRRAIAALLFLIVLVAGGVWLADALRREAAREDCLASGRRDCAVLRSDP
ncbi:hypothetical protein [Methylobacterium frigidaeris]|uniref:Uncharacterized protein n=1 Tax=Methylobacterium frigidaeris TaxID=2038277 RepID=A0AA37M557_9HYPH|nr:hypothetical protein [Methylobacterium frigidaeris]PIK69463.1 hypothetical protein CS379_29745 [Methylobacterium frigidaeris]GJD63187.1 hypothetical protein MPEAHAMD_3351 [Methylobacterium frigidaeris]